MKGRTYKSPLPPTKLLEGRLSLVGLGKGRQTRKFLASLTTFPQAKLMIDKFGGARNMARLFKECSDDPRDHYNPSSIYRWTYPVAKGGTGGEIPHQALKTIKKIARIAGIHLTADEIYGRMLKG